MFGSLRFRLPALFLGGIAIAGLVATALSIRLFQDYARDRTYAELRREARGLARLYSARAGLGAFSSAHLEQATGDRLFYAGVSLFPGEERLTGLRRLPADAVDQRAIQAGRVVAFELTPPGETRRFLAVAAPAILGRQTFGALVVDSPEADVRNRWLTLVKRLWLAFAAGILVAGTLVW